MNAHKQMPVLRTERLVIRPYTLEDASDLQRLIGDRAVAATTARVPHPYEDGMAEEFIGKQQQNFDEEKSLNLAITHREDGCLIGGIGLEFDTSRESAELGYWIGKPCWGIGYATEAAQAMVTGPGPVLGDTSPNTTDSCSRPDGSFQSTKQVRRTASSSGF